MFLFREDRNKFEIFGHFIRERHDRGSTLQSPAGEFVSGRDFRRLADIVEHCAILDRFGIKFNRSGRIFIVSDRIGVLVINGIQLGILCNALREIKGVFAVFGFRPMLEGVTGFIRSGNSRHGIAVKDRFGSKFRAVNVEGDLKRFFIGEHRIELVDKANGVRIGDKLGAAVHGPALEGFCRIGRSGSFRKFAFFDFRTVSLLAEILPHSRIRIGGIVFFFIENDCIFVDREDSIQGGVLRNALGGQVELGAVLQRPLI